jgi:preprotein translocase subunit YajC
VPDADNNMNSVLDFLISPAHAQAATPAQPSTIGFILPMIAIFAIFYFLIIRPQNKKQKELRDMIGALGVGDEVITQGGVAGKILAVGEQFLDVEIADGITVKVQRHMIAAVLPKGSLKSL